MASVDPDQNPAVTDLAIERRRIYVRRNRKNRFQTPEITDSGWDLVRYDGFAMEGYEPGVSNSEQRKDGLVSDRRYTGIHWVDENDAIGNQLLKMSGRGAF